MQDHAVSSHCGIGWVTGNEIEMAGQMNRACTGVRTDIQGLRALAVIAVVTFHVDRTWLPGGYLGVDLFFVISGFIISTLLLQQQRQKQFNLAKFYLARVQRIVPAYVAMLVCVLVVGTILLTGNDFLALWASAKSAAGFISNRYFSHYYDYFGPHAYELPLLHTWSLAVEMQFYLFMPFALLWTPSRWRVSGIALLLILLCSLIVVKSDSHGEAALYYALWARIPEFLLGVLIAVLPAPSTFVHARIVGIAGAGAIFAGFIWLDESVPLARTLALIPCAGCAAIIWAGLRKTLPVLSSPIMVIMGNYSYSLYLWHWPVLAFIRYYHNDYSLSLPLMVLAFALMAVTSYISFRWVETPLRKANWNLRLKWRVFAVTGMCLVVTLTAARGLNSRIVSPLPAPMTRYAAPEVICHGRIVGDCIRGDREGSGEVLMIGDSHAAQLNYFADAVGAFVHARIRVVTASSCVDIAGFDIDRIPPESRVACREQVERVAQYLPSAHTIILAARWDYQLPSAAFVDALKQFFRQSMERGQRVFVLAQVPSLNINLQRAVRLEALGLRQDVRANPEWRRWNDELPALVRPFPNVTLLDFTSIPLFKSVPFWQGAPIYSDSDHLNEAGSRLYGEAVKGSLGPILLNAVKGE